MSAKVNWSLEDDAQAAMRSANLNFVVSYTWLNDPARGAADRWHESLPIAADSSNFVLSELNPETEYKVRVGIQTSANEVVWSNAVDFKTEKGWSWLNILGIIGAVGLFLYGMKVMSEGVQKAAGSRIRAILNSMTANQFRGISTGFLTTAIIQSSSATTVMVVSFVNAGLLNLRQAFGVIMGANIGTTITSWLIVILGFGDFGIATLSLPLFALAIPFIFSVKSLRKSAGEFIAGFALLFMGLKFLQESIPDLTKVPFVIDLIHSWSGSGVQYLLLAVLIGTILTMIIQSSSAAMAITLILCNQGYIPFEMAAGMVLGENIGTTITANLAALVANTNAKRAALTHTIFNVIGVFWMVLIFPLFLYGLEHALIYSGYWTKPFADPEGRIVALSAFHTSFNIINTCLLVWFTKPIVSFASRIYKSKANEEEHHLEYIQTGVTLTPELGILEAQKEVARYGAITSRMAGFTRKLLFEQDKNERLALLARVEKYEEITDRVEIEIGNYLSKISEEDLSDKSSKHVRAMLSINNDLERIGDIFFQMSKSIERKDNERLWFTPEQRNNLQDLFNLVEQAFVVMNDNLEGEFLKADLQKAIDCEHRINEKRNELRTLHLENIEKQEYSVRSGMIYNDLFSSLEKVGDHIINVSEAVAGKM